MKEATFTKVEVVFWVVFILLPGFTGWLEYQPLPNEYDEERHELLESHSEECGPEGLSSCEMPDKWRDEETGRIYTAGQFTEYRRSEARRIGVIAFAYGLIACLFFAYGRVVRGRDSFLRGFKNALAVNVVVSLIVYLVV